MAYSLSILSVLVRVRPSHALTAGSVSRPLAGPLAREAKSLPPVWITAFGFPDVFLSFFA